jgi:hypothetical protein
MKSSEEITLARRISRKLKPSRYWKKMLRTQETTADGAEVYRNHIYTCTVRRSSSGWPFDDGPWAVIGIYSEDGEARHDWRDFQRIKNDICGPEWDAVELYPAESRLMDPSNYYMLWCAPSIQLGRFGGRVILCPEDCIGAQRGWNGDKPDSVNSDGNYKPSW